MSQTAMILTEEDVELTERSINELIKEYQWIVYLKANYYYSLNSEQDDIVQEGLIGLYEAIIDYDSQHDISFSAFASICIERKIISYLRNENRKKHKALNSYRSIYQPINADEGSSMLVEILDGGFQDPSSFLIEKDMYEQTERLLKKKLSDLEFTVAWLRVGGHRFSEIAEILNISNKMVDNALSRTRNKSSILRHKVDLIINGVEGGVE